MSDLTQLRKEILKKIDVQQKERLQQLIEDEVANDDNIDDEQFKSNLIKEIEEQLKQDEEEELDDARQGKKKKLTGFMKRLVDQQKIGSKREAQDLLERLKNNNNLDDFQMSEDDEAERDIDGDDDVMEDEDQKKKEKEKPKSAIKDGFIGRFDNASV